MHPRRYLTPDPTRMITSMIISDDHIRYGIGHDGKTGNMVTEAEGGGVTYTIGETSCV